MKSPHLTPILKKSGQPSKRLSVTFSQLSTPEEVDDESSTPADHASKTTTPQKRKRASASTSLEDPPVVLQSSHYGLYYKPPTPSIPDFSKLHPSVKLVELKESGRPELGNVTSDDRVLILGDAIHGQCLMKELENSTLCNIQVTLAAVPTEANVELCSFVLILLPMEVVGSCHQVMETLRRLVALRADFLLRSAVVAVTSSHGRDQHLTELLNLHTLLLQYKLSYYVWSNVTPGSWPSILERLAVEIASCRRGSVSSDVATRGRGVSRAVFSSLLWPSDSSSTLLLEYLDVTAHRTRQDLDI